MIQTLTSNHAEIVLDMLEGSENSIKIISPFITASLAKKLADIVQAHPGLSCSFITRIYLEDLICKANSIEALDVMLSAGICVYAVKGLHTKLYLFDDNKAILGSANFTHGGMKRNLELSLAMENEPIISELHDYFDELKGQVAVDGIVTKELLVNVDNDLTHLYGGKKSKTDKVMSIRMYGADAGIIPKQKMDDVDYLKNEATSGQRELNDAVMEIFREMESHDQIVYDHTIWLKFTGEASNRHAGNEIADVFGIDVPGGKLYLSNYSPSKKPSQVRDGDEIYIAPLTTDKRGKNQPVIVGRGTLRAFSKDNHASEEWIRKVSWMEDWPWYCVIDECELLDTIIENGIPLDAVLNALGSDTYISSFGRNESISEVGSKHLQKNHIRLSGNAKKFIDKRFDTLVEKYGSRRLKSV